MVTLYEFNALPLNARADYLWEHGTFVVNGADEVAAFVFYSLPPFFVEVVYDAEFNTIVSVVPFTTGDRYERMVNTMEVPGT